MGSSMSNLLLSQGTPLLSHGSSVHSLLSHGSATLLATTVASFTAGTPNTNNLNSNLSKMTTDMTNVQSHFTSPSPHGKSKKPFQFKEKTFSMKETSPNKKENRSSKKLSKSTPDRKTFVGSIKNLKLIKGTSSSVIHTGLNNLAFDLLDFSVGEFLLNYFSEIESIYGKGKAKLPKAAVIDEDDDSCITVESFRYSSKADVVFRVVQRISVVDNEDSLIIAFWTVFQDEVPSISSIANDAFFDKNNCTVANDSYSE